MSCLQSRWRFWHSMHSHWLFKTLGVMWLVLGVVSTLLPFLPAKWSEIFYGLTYLPKWHWDVWITGILIIAIITVFEGGFKTTASLQSQYEQIVSTLNDKIRKLESQVEGPELMLDYERNRDENDGHLVILHTGGGSARNIQVGQMTNGHWTSESDSISYLGIGDTGIVKTRLRPSTPEAIKAQEQGGRMPLGAFLMSSLDGKPIFVRMTYEDASLRKYETYFDVTYRKEVERPYFSQRPKPIMVVG